MLEWVFGEREGLVVARCGEDWTGPMHSVPDPPPLPPEPRRLRPHQYLGMFLEPGMLISMPILMTFCAAFAILMLVLTGKL
jgi:hypothetical protein